MLMTMSEFQKNINCLWLSKIILIIANIIFLYESFAVQNDFSHFFIQRRNKVKEKQYYVYANFVKPEKIQRKMKITRENKEEKLL